MNKLKNYPYLLPLVIGILLIVNVIQAFFTDLLADEAYYWVYSQFLNWGYFDHPPLVAVWIKLSSFLFEDELGVRFFSSIMLAVVMYLIWKLLDHPKKKEYTWLYILIFLSTALLNVYGFITTPDTPLTFFFIVFLLAYKNYLKERNIWNYALLSISMAGMMYSKYQGSIIVIFVILSNLKVLRDYKLWITSLIALALFLPHLYWQYSNEFATLKYHLLERGVNRHYKFRYTYMHIVNAIAIIGFTFPIVYKALFRGLKTKDTFHRGLNFIVLGFIIFFFIMSFKGHVQAQWIVSISIPLIYITFNYLIENKKDRGLFIKLATATIIVTVYIRFYLVHDALFPLQLEMHQNKEWVANLDAKLDGKTPLFQDSYQNTSTYWFYSQNRPCQYNSFWSRKNQYEILDFNGKCEKQNVAHVGIKNAYVTDSVFKRKHILHISYLKSYKSIRDLSHEFTEENLMLHQGLNKFKVKVINPYNNIETKDYQVAITLFSEQKKIIGSNTAKLIRFANEADDEILEVNFTKKLDKQVGYIQIISRISPKIAWQRSGPITPIKQLIE